MQSWFHKGERQGLREQNFQKDISINMEHIRAELNFMTFNSLSILFVIEVELIYNVVLVSCIQQSDSVTYMYTHTHTHTHTHTFFCRFFPL